MGHVSTSFCVSKENFDQFWEQTLKESKELGIEDPKLKRKSKIPKKLADYFIHQDEPENFADTVEGHYKAIFLKSFDLVLECMKDRFEQAGLDMYSNLQDLLLLAANGKDYSEQFKAVSTFYKGDFEENSIANLFCYV